MKNMKCRRGSLTHRLGAGALLLALPVVLSAQSAMDQLEQAAPHAASMDVPGIASIRTVSDRDSQASAEAPSVGARADESKSCGLPSTTRKGRVCLLELPFQTKQGPLLTARLMAKWVWRESGSPIVSMGNPYIEVKRGFPGERYKLRSYGGLDTLICGKLGVAPYPWRVLTTSFLGERYVRTATLGPNGVVVLNQDRSDVYIETLTCNTELY